MQVVIVKMVKKMMNCHV